jgi:hypothetical protein
MDDDEEGETLTEEALTERIRREQAVQLIEKSALLKQSFQLEPQLYDVLREVNSLLVVEHRDLAYSTFKKKCQSLVGFAAAKPELRTSQHYLALLDFLGILISWVEEQPRLAIDLEPEEDHVSEEDAIDAAVRQCMAASREASLQAFKEIAEGRR